MRRELKSLLALGCAAGALAGACCTPPEPGSLEIGFRSGPGGVFVPVEAGQTVAVILGSNGLNMVLPSLRAVDVDPSGPEPTIEVWVGGILMAADIEGTRVDMEADGAGWVLWDLRVPFQTDLCCYVCRDATVVATLEDADGRMFTGGLTVNLERGGCPDLTACCATADACPDPALTNVCM